MLFRSFLVPDDTDFGRLQRESGAVPLAASDIPGGGEGVSLQDPDGNVLWLIRRWGAVPALPLRPTTSTTFNDVHRAQRVNATVTKWAASDWFQDACERPVVLFFDEVDRGATEVRQGLFELMDSRKLAGKHIHPDTMMFEIGRAHV